MKKLSTWLIILGILIAAIPLIGRIYMHIQQERMYAQYLESLPSADILTEGFSDRLTTEEALKARNTKLHAIENVIGRIEIPAISSDQILLEGSSNKEMRFGAGHVIGS
ncbi:MAG: class D sortase, partial [Anaerovorax sp.]